MYTLVYLTSKETRFLGFCYYYIHTSFNIKLMYCLCKGLNGRQIIYIQYIEMSWFVSRYITNLQNEEAVTLSHRARLFLVGMIPMEYLRESLFVIYCYCKNFKITDSFSSSASVDLTRNESRGSSCFSFSVSNHINLTNLQYLIITKHSSQ